MTHDGVNAVEASIESKTTESDNLVENTTALDIQTPSEDQNMETEVNGSSPKTNGKHQQPTHTLFIFISSSKTENYELGLFRPYPNRSCCCWLQWFYHYTAYGKIVTNRDKVMKYFAFAYDFLHHF
jgi:hypothetical protein